ncbi:MAG: tetratricopeptide repeat protein [Flavobacteriales bacterium]|nr:tetratricopeptide repeat protein [Flavobacteriales bacterium]
MFPTIRFLWVISVLVVLLLAACGGGEVKDSESAELAVIDSLETILFTDEGGMDNRAAAQLLVRSYATYYQHHKSDSTAIDMLFKAGEVSMGLGDGRLAVKYFGTVAEEHPEFRKAPEALFLQGFCEENLNGDMEQAKFFYSDFIAKHPGHVLVEDARFSIENLGKTDEELIKMFEQLKKEE